MLLVGQLLGMHEGQIEEDPQLLVDRFVHAGLERALRKTERQRVGRIHMRRAAKAVARELVEQDHQRQRAIRLLHPVVEFASSGREMQVMKAVDGNSRSKPSFFENHRSGPASRQNATIS